MVKTREIFEVCDSEKVNTDIVSHEIILLIAESGKSIVVDVEENESKTFSDSNSAEDYYCELLQAKHDTASEVIRDEIYNVFGKGYIYYQCKDTGNNDHADEIESYLKKTYNFSDDLIEKAMQITD